VLAVGGEPRRRPQGHGWLFKDKDKDNVDVGLRPTCPARPRACKADPDDSRQPGREPAGVAENRSDSGR